MTENPRAAWATPAEVPPDGLHVWRIGLGVLPAVEPAELPEEEAARARRLVDPVARRRFLALRCATRTILARYVGGAPGAIRFGRAARGKPFVLEPATDWVFNLADSRDLALLAVSRRGPVGIDLEALRDIPRRDDIARRMFADDRVAALAASPADARDALFFRHWTAFEALQKATGAGMSGPRADPAAWRVHHFVPEPGYVAALVHPVRAEPDIRFFSLPG